MGSWDYKLFDNDDACDIRDDYREKIIMGMNDDEAESFVISEFEMYKEENYMLWLPLAVTEWKIGRLGDKVKGNALHAVKIELSEISEIWEPKYVENEKMNLLNTVIL